VSVVRLPDRHFAGYIFDLDGTVYLGDRLLPGAGETILHLRASGARVAFLTNNPLSMPAAYAQKLTALGVPTQPDNVVSSTDALLRYLGERAAGARLYPVSEPLLAGLLRDAGFELSTDPEAADVVVVAFDRTFDYAKLEGAYRAVRAGARIVATNPDPYCPTPDGGLPDCGAILAAIETATGRRAEATVGKPSVHMSDAVLARLGLPAGDCLLTGDRLLTDVQMAHNAGMASALVLTGATSLAEADAGSIRPDFVLRSLADLIPAPIPSLAAGLARAEP
jgi:HAD superfamily hydrolase (TIGR01450 family)